MEIGKGYDKGFRGPYNPAARDEIPCRGGLEGSKRLETLPLGRFSA